MQIYGRIWSKYHKQKPAFSGGSYGECENDPLLKVLKNAGSLTFIIGGLAEWSKAADLRSAGQLSARVRTSHPSLFFFVVQYCPGFLQMKDRSNRNK